MSEVHRCTPYRRHHGARLRKLAEAYPVIAEVRNHDACFLLEGTHLLYCVPQLADSGERGTGMGLGNRSEGGRHSRSQGHGAHRRFRALGFTGVAAAAAVLTVAGCSSSTSSSSSSSASAPVSTAASSSAPASATVPA